MTHTGKPHARAYLTSLTTGVSHGCVTAEPKLSPIQKRLILRVLRHSKTYKYTLKEEEKGHTEREEGNYSRKLIDPSQKPDLSSRLKISPQFPFRSFGCFFMFCIHYSSEMFSFLVMN
ncbi:hypothetical protein F383_11498 [Gossypium arboreum]|uniref:Uncharacterized protein n=1 Tax=Gossypium arboreum TaxID=29729 RepID=A0A0B0Q1D3_GOSAR|nr:hypothetical protein F383_11498 [Gossypium arboreum]